MQIMGKRKQQDVPRTIRESRGGKEKAAATGNPKQAPQNNLNKSAYPLIVDEWTKEQTLKNGC